MKNTTFKKLIKVQKALSETTKSKKERIALRSERLDPNNAENKKAGPGKEKVDDGFEHRESKDTVGSLKTDAGE